ncbi:hypothetical protein F5Y16DRAFT_404178 [Xylariaceae sp. FL0255]|nr:hypothetical protein F5Y16DRAFT_404178 [Xylariaceae sp. FL0255]
MGGAPVSYLEDCPQGVLTDSRNLFLVLRWQITEVDIYKDDFASHDRLLSYPDLLEWSFLVTKDDYDTGGMFVSHYRRGTESDTRFVEEDQCCVSVAFPEIDDLAAVIWIDETEIRGDEFVEVGSGAGSWPRSSAWAKDAIRRLEIDEVIGTRYGATPIDPERLEEFVQYAVGEISSDADTQLRIEVQEYDFATHRVQFFTKARELANTRNYNFSEWDFMKHDLEEKKENRRA